MEWINSSCERSEPAALERGSDVVRIWIEDDSEQPGDGRSEVGLEESQEGVLTAVVEWMRQQLSSSQVVRARQHFETALKKEPQSVSLQLVVSHLDRALQKPRPSGFLPGCGPLI